MSKESWMRICHSVSSMENEAAGTTYVVRSIAQSVAAVGVEVDVYSLGEAGGAPVAAYGDIRFKRDFSGIGPLRKLGLSSAMRDALLVYEGAVIHAHGLWMMPAVYAADAARQRGQSFMLSPHGMLGKEALAFSRMKKRLFWAALQGEAARSADCLHATGDQEYHDIRDFGLTRPVAVIPNGIDLPLQPARTSLADPRQPFVLSLGRIHPIKALDRLIRAWALVAPDFPHWRLKLVGPSELGYADELKRLAKDLKLSSVDVSDSVFGDEKFALLAKAEVFALPTLHENFAMTVAESLASGTPVISTKGAPWAGLEANGCGWWVEHGPEAMAVALRSAMSLSPEQRRAMGERGRGWMERDFAWEGIARQMIDVYRWLAGGGDCPASVRVD